MKFKNLNKSRIRLVLTVFLAFAVLTSCNKENSVENPGKAKVVLKVAESNGATNELKASANRSRNSSVIVKEAEIVYNSDITLVATLQKVGGTSSSGLKASNNKAANTGTSENLLTNGTKYTVLAFQEDKLKSSQDFVVGSENSFELDPGTYTFITYAVKDGFEFTAPTGDLSLTSFPALASGADIMYASKEQTIVAGSVNNLSVTLKHLFSELTVKLNTSELGDANIGSGLYSMGALSGVVKLSDGGLAVSPDKVAVPIIFPQGVAQEFASLPFMVIPTGDPATIQLTGVVIDGVTKNLTIGDLDVESGTRYELVLNLKKKQIANVGGINLSLGALTYDRTTGEYGFSGNNEPGAYFFPDRVIPKDLIVGNGNQGPNASNGATGDPCALVAPAGSWRLPTTAEVNTLVSSTEPGGISNPGTPTPWSPARWTDYYSTTNTGIVGVFFGSQVRPAEAVKESYLFMPFFGAYHDNFDISGNLGTQGYYLLSDSANPGKYMFWHLTGQPNSLNYGTNIIQAGETSAVQVVCVKSN
ncbi:fimbrillin family protein [Sphingobacterium kyonggiense]